MPEFTVKEVRLPELHLPEIKRDEIVRALSGVRLPDVDLAKARRATIKVPAVTFSADDVGRMIAAGAAITRFARPKPRRSRAPWKRFGRRSDSPIKMIVKPRSRRSRRPLLFGALIVAVVAVWGVMRNPAIRRRIEAASQDARERFETWRAQDLRPEIQPRANTSTDVAGGPVQGLANATDDATDLAGGISADDVATPDAATDDVPAFEESQASR